MSKKKPTKKAAASDSIPAAYDIKSALKAARNAYPDHGQVITREAVAWMAFGEIRTVLRNAFKFPDALPDEEAMVERWLRKCREPFDLGNDSELSSDLETAHQEWENNPKREPLRHGERPPFWGTKTGDELSRDFGDSTEDPAEPPTHGKLPKSKWKCGVFLRCVTVNKGARDEIWEQGESEHSSTAGEYETFVNPGSRKKQSVSDKRPTPIEKGLYQIEGDSHIYSFGLPPGHIEIFEYKYTTKEHDDFQERHKGKRALKAKWCYWDKSKDTGKGSSGNMPLSRLNGKRLRRVIDTPALPSVRQKLLELAGNDNSGTQQRSHCASTSHHRRAKAVIRNVTESDDRRWRALCELQHLKRVEQIRRSVVQQLHDVAGLLAAGSVTIPGFREAVDSVDRDGDVALLSIEPIAAEALSMLVQARDEALSLVQMTDDISWGALDAVEAAKQFTQKLSKPALPRPAWAREAAAASGFETLLSGVQELIGGSRKVLEASWSKGRDLEFHWNNSIVRPEKTAFWKEAVRRRLNMTTRQVFFSFKGENDPDLKGSTIQVNNDFLTHGDGSKVTWKSFKESMCRARRRARGTKN